MTCAVNEMGLESLPLLSSSYRQGRFVQLIGGCTLFACLLGIALDVVTANVAVEYFTVHHPRLIASQNPWAMALLWGVVAAWWAGALGGAFAAMVNEFRSSPLPPRQILRWVEIACVVLWGIMILILVGIYFAAEMVPMDARRESFESDRRLVAVAMAHQYEYWLGIVAAIVVGFKIWRAR